MNRWNSKLQKFTRRRRVSKKRKATRRPSRRRVPKKRKATRRPSRRRVSKKSKATRRPSRRRVSKKSKTFLRVKTKPKSKPKPKSEARKGKKSNIKRFYQMFSTPRMLIVQKMDNGLHNVYFSGPGPTDPIELLAKGLTLDAASNVFAQEITNDIFSLPPPDSNYDEMPDLFK
jgi:hypothetical protein